MVKVPGDSPISEGGLTKKRMPELCACILLKGMIVGEIDIAQENTVYTSTYYCETDCAIFEMPLSVYSSNMKESMKSNERYPEKAAQNMELKMRNDARADRAKHSVKSLMVNSGENAFLKHQLEQVLPCIIDIDSRRGVRKAFALSHLGRSLQSSKLTATSASIASGQSTATTTKVPTAPAASKSRVISSIHSPRSKFLR